jgi:hypothetical protein
MIYSEIEAPIAGGALTLRLADAYHPQSVTGNVWRYVKDGDKWKADGKAGVITPFLPVVPIGAPAAVDGKLFLVVGAVLQHGDDPPTPYQVIASIRQGDTVLHHEVPPEGGSGSLGSENAPFLYRFVVKAT